MEIDLGEWQGLREEEIKSRNPEEFHAYWNEPSSFESIGGESFMDVKRRISEFLLELEQTKPTGNILVVTHGVVIKALYLLCRNESIEHIWKPPFIHGTSLTIIRVEAGIMELCLEACTNHCS
ncbi:histidine phosphatase family protein [Bacillus sp. Bva_UNVM-123]|uniref:histidine phosphatase family protein n=1 Tax=Bacillus sp. Bva_UNVM-123 TaxID=2829798 RepID=UPI00391F600D